MKDTAGNREQRNKERAEQRRNACRIPYLLNPIEN